MYEAQELLGKIDDHTAPILIGFTVAMIFQTVWMVDAIRVTKREGVYSIPLFCTFFWFAHDLGCAVRFDDWFNTYDHWFMKCFWVGLVSAVILELVFFAQILRYARAEVAPQLSQAQFTALIAAGAVGAVVVWEYTRSIVDDPLYFSGTAPTMFLYLFFSAGLYLRRGGPAGQSALMWIGFIGIATSWHITAAIWFTDAFHSWQYISMGVIDLVGGLLMLRLVTRDRAALAQSGDAVVIRERVAA
jgi:hypothetical protein